ncbi:MAG: hypothetical protein GY798_32915 [Hyphomicrobiales bacterium]|nr:hypothetical protein [Hyphomicrobiales bacterium]
MSAPAEKLLLIGLDAGDQDFIREHVTDLPNLARFFSESTVHPLAAEPMSGAVWNSFSTRSKPGHHGRYHHLQWNPDRMRVQRIRTTWLDDIPPFWRAMAAAGKRVTVLDVPCVFAGDSRGALEVLNWGSHDLIGPYWSSDSAEARRIRSRFGMHPMGFEIPVQKSARRLASDRDDLTAGAGARSRLVRDLMTRKDWDLFIVVFGETHRGGHILYPTGEAETSVPTDALLDVYRAVDRAVGEILADLESGCDVILFALHGMGPNTSQAHLSRQMLTTAMGALPNSDSNAASRTGLAHWLRRTVPPTLQDKVAHAVPVQVRDFVVARSITGGMSAGVTRAISLDGDLSGYWRLMIDGREAGGGLTPAQAEDLSLQLAEDFMRFTTLDGRQLVRKVYLAKSDMAGPRSQLLPDIVAEWHDLAPVEAARHPALGVIHGKGSTGRGGNHKMNGFFAHRGPRQGQGPLPGHISEFGDLVEALAR